MTGVLSGGIPKVFHRVWFGGSLPGRLAELGNSFRRLHPDWEQRVWNETNLPPLRNQVVFDRATSFAMKADIVRYEVIRQFGGVYLDTDFESLRPLDPLIDDLECFAALEDSRWIAIGLIGARPHHPFFERIVGHLADSLAAHTGAAANVVTGPQYFTRCYEAASAAVRASVSLLPPATVYPYHFSEPDRAAGPFPDAFAVHHWDHAW